MKHELSVEHMSGRLARRWWC